MSGAVFKVISIMYRTISRHPPCSRHKSLSFNVNWDRVFNLEESNSLWMENDVTSYEKEAKFSQ